MIALAISAVVVAGAVAIGLMLRDVLNRSTAAQTARYEAMKATGSDEKVRALEAKVEKMNDRVARVENRAAR